MSVLRGLTGIGAASSIALGLLAGGCVLAATAGPGRRRRPGRGRCSRRWTACPRSEERRGHDQLGRGQHRLRRRWRHLRRLRRGTEAGRPRRRHQPAAPGLRRRTAPAGPAVGRLGEPTANLYYISPLPILKGIPAKLEVAYRTPLAGRLRLVAAAADHPSPPR